MKDTLRKITDFLSYRRVKEQRMFLAETRIVILNHFFNETNKGVGYFFLRHPKFYVGRMVLSHDYAAFTAIDNINDELRLVKLEASQVKFSRIMVSILLTVFLAAIIVVLIFGT